MTQDIQTRQVGYAPDERGRDHPPEIVYLTDAPVRARPSWKLKILTLASLAICVFGFVLMVREAFTDGLSGSALAFAIIAALYGLTFLTPKR